MDMTTVTFKCPVDYKIIMKMLADLDNRNLTSYLLDLVKKDALSYCGVDGDMLINTSSLVAVLVKEINEHAECEEDLIYIQDYL